MAHPVITKTKRQLDAMAAGRLRPMSGTEEQAVAALREGVRSLSARRDTAYESERFWTEQTLRLRDRILSDDPRAFLTWDVISDTMFVDSSRYLPKELHHLKRAPDWRNRWRAALRESRFGCPPRCLYYPASSGNLIHHAYHVKRFEEVTGRRVQDMSLVVEFGGGYGSMCRLFFRLGFRGMYLILDLPAFSLLQTYYLGGLGLPIREASSPEPTNPAILCTSDLAQARDLASTLQGTVGALFVATWSISEAPIPVREPLLSSVSGFDAFLIAYQQRFRELDNSEFFAHWTHATFGIRWLQASIPHLPGQNYLFGTKRA